MVFPSLRRLWIRLAYDIHLTTCLAEVQHALFPDVISFTTHISGIQVVSYSSVSAHKPQKLLPSVGLCWTGELIQPAYPRSALRPQTLLHHFLTFRSLRFLSRRSGGALYTITLHSPSSPSVPTGNKREVSPKFKCRMNPWTFCSQPQCVSGRCFLWPALSNNILNQSTPITNPPMSSVNSECAFHFFRNEQFTNESFINVNVRNILVQLFRSIQAQRKVVSLK